MENNQKELLDKIETLKSEIVKLENIAKKNMSVHVTERIKTLQDAIDYCKPSDFVLSILNYDGDDIGGISARNNVRLEIIIQALNEGWIPNFKDGSERKWRIWFNTTDYQSKDSLGGFSFYFTLFGDPLACVGFRLCFQNEKIATYAAKQFLPYFKAVMDSEGK